MIDADLLLIAVQILCDLTIIIYRLKYGDGYFLLTQILKVYKKKHMLNELTKIRVEYYYNWLRKYIQFISDFSMFKLFETFSCQPQNSPIRQNFYELVISNQLEKDKEDDFNCKLNCFPGNAELFRISLFRCFALGLQTNLISNSFQLYHNYCSKVFCFSWSTDGSRLVSGSSDRTCRVWDVNTGLLIGILVG
jgi:WD40 repeat protein